MMDLTPCPQVIRELVQVVFSNFLTQHDFLCISDVRKDHVSEPSWPVRYRVNTTFQNYPEDYKNIYREVREIVLYIVTLIR